MLAESVYVPGLQTGQHNQEVPVSTLTMRANASKVNDNFTCSFIALMDLTDEQILTS